MRILFIHDNFPAQFGRFGQFLAQSGWDVHFATQRQGLALEGVTLHHYKPHRAMTQSIHPYAANFEKAVLSGQGFARTAVKLRDRGFQPDIVMAHSGWGPGLFTKDIWPETAYIGYFEWYYNIDAPDILYMDDHSRSLDDDLRGRSRNAAILSDLAACEMGVVPTQFQKLQFPSCFDGKLTVMHDGIDTDLHRPVQGARLVLEGLDLSGVEEIVTYVARGMEPYRGFPEFMAAVEQIQQARPQTHVVVVGEDRVAYGRKLPEGESFKKKALETLKLDLSRVHFTGPLSRSDYLKVLQASSVHVYLTIPFVLSWSMMEAMSAGCAMVVSDTEPVLELHDEETACIVDLREPVQIATAVAALLDDPDRRASLGAAARERIVGSYAINDLYPQKKTLLQRLVG